MPDDPAERLVRLFAIFKDAIASEREAQATYQQAAELCEDPELKRIFAGLYQDELRHEKSLVQQYERIREQRVGTHLEDIVD